MHQAPLFDNFLKAFNDAVLSRMSRLDIDDILVSSYEVLSEVEACCANVLSSLGSRRLEVS